MSILWDLQMDEGVSNDKITSLERFHFSFPSRGRNFCATIPKESQVGVYGQQNEFFGGDAVIFYNWLEKSGSLTRISTPFPSLQRHKLHILLTFGASPKLSVSGVHYSSLKSPLSVPSWCCGME